MEFAGSCVEKNCLVIGMSESGNSLSTLEAMRWAKEKGCITLGFTTDATSELAENCTYLMKHPCKMKLVPPETKGYTTALLAWIVAIHYAAGTEVEAKEAIETLHKTIEKSENWVMQNLRDLIRYDRMRVVGSNLHYISSKEGALKMQETIRRPLSAKEMEEFSHIADLALEDTDCILMIVRTI